MASILSRSHCVKVHPKGQVRVLRFVVFSCGLVPIFSITFRITSLALRQSWSQDWFYRFAPSQRETSLQSNAVSHWLSANLESALWSSASGAKLNNVDKWITVIHQDVWYNQNNTQTLKEKCCYFDEIFVLAQIDNFCWSQRGKFRKNDHISVSVKRNIQI